MPIKLRQIEAFRTVMREGSMVRASAAMAVTQPAISYMISGLEAAVGFPLLIDKEENSVRHRRQSSYSLR